MNLSYAQKKALKYYIDYNCCTEIIGEPESKEGEEVVDACHTKETDFEKLLNEFALKDENLVETAQRLLSSGASKSLKEI